MLVARMQAASPTASTVGVNLGQVTSNGPMFIFTDLFKHSVPFYPMTSRDNVTWLWFNPQLLSKNGTRSYPNSIPVTVSIHKSIHILNSRVALYFNNCTN